MPESYLPSRIIILLAIYGVFFASIPVVMGWVITTVGEMFYTTMQEAAKASVNTTWNE